VSFRVKRGICFDALGRATELDGQLEATGVGPSLTLGMTARGAELGMTEKSERLGMTEALCWRTSHSGHEQHFDPRWRDRLGEEAMSEGATQAAASPRYGCDCATSDGPPLLLAAGPERVDEGGGHDTGLWRRVWRVVGPVHWQALPSCSFSLADEDFGLPASGFGGVRRRAAGSSPVTSRSFARAASSPRLACV
jgi:hypothetical protein